MPVTSAESMLVLGESLVDVVRAADGTSSDLAGGSPANVAVALARLGAQVELVTGYGDDPHGDLLETHLASSGVRLVGDPRILPRTSTAVATLDERGAASYVFDIINDLTEPEPTPDRIHVHAGSIGAVLEPGSRVVARTMAAHASTGTVSYDINVRPAVSGVGPSVVQRTEELCRLSDVVKASDEDLVAIYPGLLPDEAARHLLRLGPAAVVVTRGAAGASCYTPREDVEVPGVSVDVVDTIGAGDSFCAGMLDGLRRSGYLGAARRTALHSAPGDLWRAVIARAAAAAAISVSRAGADPPSAAELDAFDVLDTVGAARPHQR